MVCKKPTDESVGFMVAERRSRYDRTDMRIRDDIAEALAAGRPVVALESTLFVHGLPRPVNLEVASEIERIVRDEGAVPATIGIVGGEVTVVLTAHETERIRPTGGVPTEWM